jgi:hypothetical protein
MRHGATPAPVLAPACFLAMLAMPALAVGDDLVLPDSRLGTRTAPLLLLSRPDVQADLKMTPQQVADARQAIAELREKAAALHGKTDDGAVEARRAIDEGQGAWLQAHLTAEQKARLAQIDLQWEGPSALASRASLGKALSLSDKQRAALAQAVERRNQVRQTHGWRPEDDRRLAEQALAVLTTEQKAQWKTVLGATFVVQTAETARAEARR